MIPAQVVKAFDLTMVPHMPLPHVVTVWIWFDSDSLYFKGLYYEPDRSSVLTLLIEEWVKSVDRVNVEIC